MFSKNNSLLNEIGNAETLPHYSLRKLSVGVVSVLLGTALMIGGNSTAQASEQTGDDMPISQASQTSDSEKTADTASETPSQQVDYQAQAVTLVLGKDNIDSPAVDSLLTADELKQLNVANSEEASLYWTDDNISSSNPGKYENVRGTLDYGNQEKSILFPSVTVRVEPLPLYTTVNELPDISVNALLTSRVRDLLGIDEENAKTRWISEKPNVSQATEIGDPVTGTVQITYPDPEKSKSSKTLTLPVNIIVRAGEKKNPDQVKNQVNFIDEETNQIVYSYSLLGKENSSIDNAPDQFSISNALNLLGYQVDNASEADLANFSDHDQTFNLFVKADCNK